ncbi:MAG: hypothetical protein ACFFC3_00165 [Candidatus Odinarchaeota archaeon]
MSESSIDFEKEIRKDEFWKYWINRIKFDTPLWLIFLAIYFIQAIIFNGYISGFENYFTEGGYITDFIIISAFIFIVYLSVTGPKDFVKIINKLYKEEVFIKKDDKGNKIEDYSKTYAKILFHTYKSKIEKYLPLICSIAFVIGTFIYYFCYIKYDIFDLIIAIWYVLFSISFFIIILLLVAAVIEWSYADKFINVLGNKAKLYIKYEHLINGVFNNIGKFILKITISSSLLGTSYSILGLIQILILRRYMVGYIFIGISLGITVFLIVSFYKNTINLHKAIVTKKEDLIENLLAKISEVYIVYKSEYYQRYQTIYNIHECIDRIDKISDWPFNPTSFRKFIITISSSVVPLLLSLFGFV